MLIDFQVKNFRSFKDEVSFSMEIGLGVSEHETSTIMLKDEELLKSAVVFGGNANGKSNLIDAFALLKDLILKPTSSENMLLSTDTFAHNHKEVAFKIKFIKNENLYDYQLIYTSEEILMEGLLVNGVENFKRIEQDIQVYPKQLKVLLPTIRKNQLFLFFAQNNNSPEAKQVFSWFVDNLIFVDTDDIDTSIFQKLTDETLKDKFIAFLRAADINISDIEILERKQIHIYAEEKRNVYELYSTHELENNETFKLNFWDESAGTQAFMAIAIHLLLNESQQDKVFLIDEFNRSFHLELAEALIEIFNHEKQRNQFIVTSHELTLMDFDLRQDQIWFAEKTRYGQTELFSVYDFEKAPKNGHKKYYLDGRYGAKPIIIKDLLQSFLGGQDG